MAYGLRPLENLGRPRRSRSPDTGGPTLANLRRPRRDGPRGHLAALAQSFTKLLAVAEGKGKVVISCRDPYFPNEADLKGTTEQSLAHSLGNRVGYTRFDLQPFSPENGCAGGDEVGLRLEATTRLASLNPPLELDRQPLLLRMVLNTLGSLPPGQTLTRGDLYESYFRDWVEKTSDSACSLAAKGPVDSNLTVSRKPHG